MAIERFDRLEAGISRLLESNELLQAENRSLRDSLELKERGTDELKEKIRKLEAEKALVKEKVDTLLTRLDGLIQNA
ncbi:MAG: cell division protein ZapB [Deltaproteobacteria bacterium]|nr:cell division protein ZapB [Deltaproteobacteria bacterium]